MITIALALALLTTPAKPAEPLANINRNLGCRVFNQLDNLGKQAMVQAYMAGVAIGGDNAGGNVMHFLQIAPGRYSAGDVANLVAAACVALPDESVPAILRTIAVQDNRKREIVH